MKKVFSNLLTPVFVNYEVQIRQKQFFDISHVKPKVLIQNKKLNEFSNILVEVADKFEVKSSQVAATLVEGI